LQNFKRLVVRVSSILCLLYLTWMSAKAAMLIAFAATIRCQWRRS
jgi:hypothetical protein